MEGADTDPKQVSDFPPFRDALKPLENVRYSYQTGANHKSGGWVDLQVVGARTPSELQAAFAKISALRPDALITLRDNFTIAHAQRIAEY